MIKKGGVDLASFVGGLVRALTKAQQALPRSRREQIEKHFDKDDNGIYHPKMTTFQLNDHQQVSVPNYSLSRVNNIGIESAIIRGCARIVDIEDNEMNCELTDHSHLATYYVKAAGPMSKSFEIEIKFAKKLDCESENRLAESLDGLVEVQPVAAETS